MFGYLVFVLVDENEICKSVEEDPTKFQVPDPEDCTKFYYCLKDQYGNWIAKQFSCPATTGFNIDTRTCDFLYNLPYCS